MRIAQVVSSFSPHVGGVETHVARLSQGLCERGDQVTVLTHGTGASPARDRIGAVEVLRFPLAVKLGVYTLSPALFRYIARHRGDFDVIHGHSYHTLVSHSAIRTGLPFIFTPHYHGTGHTPFRAFLHRLYRPAGARLFGAAAAVICVSGAEHALVIKDFPVAAGKVVTIPNGTDRREPARAGDHPGVPVVLTVGRLERYKNVHLIIDAFRALPAPAVLVVVGDGPDRRRLEQHARESRTGWPVVFTGKIPGTVLDQWFARAHVVVSASDHEAYGLTLADGLAAGAQVVASAIPAHTEVAARAGSGAPVSLIDPRDRQRFTGTIAACLRTGRPRNSELRLPSWADVAEATREVYSRVCAPGTSPAPSHVHQPAASGLGPGSPL